MERGRIAKDRTFKERLAEEAQRYREAAAKERPGTMARELLLRRARQAETASDINDRLASPSQDRAQVNQYRAYTVGTDGHFVGFEPMICRDDAEAITRAQRLFNNHDIEIWNFELGRPAEEGRSIGETKPATKTADASTRSMNQQDSQSKAAGMPDRIDVLKIGLRVRLTPLGLQRSPKTDTQTGVIVGVKPTSSTVRVLLDGRRVPLALHRSYIEPEQGASAFLT